MGTNDLSLGPAACPFLIPGRRSKHFDMDGKLSVSLNTITLAASETRESVGAEIILTTNSSYLTGSNLTYSGGRGSSALKIGVTFSGLGGAHGIYVKLDTSGAQVTDGHGVIGIKCIVVNTAALSDGEVYGAQFIAKHNHATNVMTAQASLIGLEAWAYISDAGPARTVIGGNFAIHNECTGTPGAGSVHRVVQLVCDNASGAVVAEEATGLCVWEMAGTWHNAIKVVASVTAFTKGLYFVASSVVTAIDVAGCSVFADADVTLATADNAMEIIVTSTAAVSTGYIQALQLTINHSTGALTGSSELHVLALDTTLTGGSSRGVPYWYAQTIYMSQSANPVVGGEVSAISIYIDNLGNAISNLCAISIGIDQSGGDPSGRFSFFRLRSHNATYMPVNIFNFEGQGAAENFFTIDVVANMCSVTSGATTPTHKIQVNIAGATRYIKLYSDA